MATADPMADEVMETGPDDEEAEIEAAVKRGRLFFPQFMVHRRLVGDRWQSCHGTDEGHELDSCVHAYDREHGFLRANEDQEMIDRNTDAAAAFERRRTEAFKAKAHNQVVERWGLFERFVLARMPDEPYAGFLRSCESAEPTTRLSFQPPPVALVVTYQDFLRKDPRGEHETHKAGSIKVYLGGISSTCFEFGIAASPVHADDVSKQLKKWKDEDGEEASEAFDMESDLKKMWSSVWTLGGWSMLHRCQTWAMLLVAIALFARASEVTQFCPTMEDMELPEAESQWDADGLPKWLDLGLRRWKTRTKAHQGKRYGMRLWRNYVDTRFCPVSWLLTHLHYSGIQSGTIFQSISGGKMSGDAMSEGSWENTTKRIFTHCGLYTPGRTGADGSYIKPTGVTNHGVRRSAAQWAGRCGGREIDVANNGRWKTFTEMIKYMAQGATRRKRCEQDDGEDPIFSTWVWKPVTVAGESTRHEL